MRTIRKLAPIVLLLLLSACALAGSPAPAAAPTGVLIAAPAPALASPAATSAPAGTAGPDAAPAATLTPAAVATPSAPALVGEIVAPTATPAFPDAQISADRIGDLRLLRVVGRGQVRFAAFAPGGRVLAAGTTAGVLLLALPDLRELRFIPIAGAPTEVAFSPDGDLIAIGFAPAAGGPPRTHVRRVDGDQLVADLAGAAPVFSPDRQLIATALPGDVAGGPTAQLWRIADGSRVATFAGAVSAFSRSGGLLVDSSPEAGVGMVELRRPDGALVLRAPGDVARISPDEALLAIADGPDVNLHRLADGQLIATLATGAGGRLAALEFTPDGRKLRVLADLGVQTWDIASRQLERAAAGLALDGDIDRAQFSPGGLALLVRESLGEAGAQLTLFDAADGHKLLQRPDPLARGSFAFDAEGSLAALVIDGELDLLDLAGQPRGQVALPGFERIAFSPDAQTLATANDAAVMLWRITDGAPERTLARNPGCPVITRRSDWLSYGADGSLLAATAGSNFGGAFLSATRWDRRLATAADRCFHADEQILWAFAGARSALAFGRQLEIHGADALTHTVGLASPASALALSPDAALVALAGADGGVQLFDVAGALVGALPLEGAAAELAFSPDGSLLAARRADGAAWVWQVGPRALLAQIDLGPGVRRAIFTADNQLLIAGGAPGVSFYRVSGGQRLGAIAAPADDLAIGPRRRLLAVLSGGQVQLWGIP